MTDTIYCAVCGGRFSPDTDHVQLDAEKKRQQDRNEQEMWILHPECYRRLTEGWMTPA